MVSLCVIQHFPCYCCPRKAAHCLVSKPCVGVCVTDELKMSLLTFLWVESMWLSDSQDRLQLWEHFPLICLSQTGAWFALRMDLVLLSLSVVPPVAVEGLTSLLLGSAKPPLQKQHTSGWRYTSGWRLHVCSCVCNQKSTPLRLWGKLSSYGYPRQGSIQQETAPDFIPLLPASTEPWQSLTLSYIFCKHIKWYIYISVALLMEPY